MSEGKAVVVTGGARGIGRGIGAWLLGTGYRVALLDSDEPLGRRTAEELGGDGDVLFLHADVTVEDEVRAAMTRAVERFGRLDALVNNAGLATPFGTPVESLQLAEWNRVLGVNLTGGFLCAKHAVPHLRTTGGSIVNIASTRACQSEPHGEAYAASKGGMVALTHALAISLGPEVRVNGIAPGWIDVRDESLRPEDHTQHPVGRVGKAKDVAALVAFLISEDAGFVTGQTFVVDGGMTRKMIYEE